MAATTKRQTSKAPDSLPTITDRAMFEIVDGRLEEMEPMSVYSIRIAALIYGHLFHYCQIHRNGEAAIENLFRLPLAKPKSRRPDVAFVSAQRWPLGQPMPLTGEAWDVVPDLVVEVVSPTDRATQLERKLDEYFEAGVRRAWVVHPESQIIEIYRMRHDIQVLKASDELTDEEVLPGFRLPIKSVFPPFSPADSD